MTDLMQESETLTLDEFIARYRLTMKAQRTSQNPYMPDCSNMDHWQVRLLRNDGHRRSQLMTYFSMGYGHFGVAPTAALVLSSFADDYTDETFDEWCKNFDYDTDSRKAERTFKHVQIVTRRLERFLGSYALEMLVFHTERL